MADKSSRDDLPVDVPLEGESGLIRLATYGSDDRVRTERFDRDSRSWVPGSSLRAILMSETAKPEYLAQFGLDSKGNPLSSDGPEIGVNGQESPRTGDSDDGYFRAVRKAMGWNLAWYFPLATFIFFYVVVANAVSAYNNVAEVISRWTWAILLSPAAYLFFSSELALIFLPIKMMAFIPTIFGDAENKRKYITTAFIVVLLFAACFLLQVVIWGSFPLGVDKEGYIRLRMIPFIPWPDSPFLQ